MPYIVSFFFTLYKSCHLAVCATTDDASNQAHNKKRILILRLISIFCLINIAKVHKIYCLQKSLFINNVINKSQRFAVCEIISNFALRVDERQVDE